MRYTTIVGIFTVMLMLVSGLVFAETESPSGTTAVEEGGVMMPTPTDPGSSGTTPPGPIETEPPGGAIGDYPPRVEPK